MQKNTIIIGISGASASGKSLLANTIVEELGTKQVEVISEDSYYRDQKHLSFEERTQTNYDHPNAFDHDLLCKHLKKLHDGETIQVPVYDHTQHIRSEDVREVGNHAIIVLEGILLFTDQVLRELMDIRIFMDTPLDTCLIRRLKRDIIERERSLESVLDQYEKTVKPMYQQFIEPSKRYAHIIVPHGGANRIAIDIIKAKMREMLGAYGQAN
ncbi:MAG: uridine kinase [marine bacterium B5-7]|nr:MAG: uridine kinase [marine bacterium B5-7]